MKNIKYLLLFCSIIIGIAACEEKLPTPSAPSAISDIKTFPLPGQIGITWKRTEPVNFKYLKFTYFDKLLNKEVVRLASQYSDTIIIPDTRKKFGEYSFEIQPFNYIKGLDGNDVGGQTYTTTGVSDAAPKTITVVGVTAIKLTEGQLFTDAQEPTEGPIKNLIDNDPATFFHAAWSKDFGPMPHYIVVDLGKQVHGFKFNYVTRDNAGTGNHPKLMDIYLSNAFDPTAAYDVTGLKKVDALSGLPNGKKITYNSGDYIMDQSYRYVWFQVKETHGGTKYFAMADLNVSELQLKVIDPEAN